jgi:hypothetical protein
MRSDADNIRKLEQLRPRHEQLKTMKIKLASESERREAEIAAAEAEAMELVGTSNEDEIRQIMTENWAANTDAVDGFEAILVEIENELKALGETTEVGTASRPAAPMMRPAVPQRG